MTMPSNVLDREYDKFQETQAGETAVRVIIKEDESAGGVGVNPTITTTTVPLQNTETPLVLPVLCKGFVLRPRTACRLKIAYVSGGTDGNNFMSVGLGGHWKESNTLQNKTVFVKTDRDNIELELLTYS